MTGESSTLTHHSILYGSSLGDQAPANWLLWPGPGIHDLHDGS